MFGMPKKRSLGEELAYLERTDPKVGAAGKRLDNAMDSIILQAQIAPDVQKARREACLNLIREQMLAKDQKGVERMIVAAIARGHKIDQSDFDAISATLPQDVRDYWSAPCTCGGDSCALAHVEL